MKLVKISLENYEWLKNFGTSPNKGLDHLRILKPLQDKLDKIEQKVEILGEKYLKGGIYKD
jgi:hypothetical protein